MREKYTAQKMAQHFGCSTKLIYKKCYSFGIKFRNKYYIGSDEELQQEIGNLHNQFPNSGSQVKIFYYVFLNVLTFLYFR